MANNSTYSIYLLTYKKHKYKVLLRDTEELGNSHIYPIYVDDDTTIKDIPFFLGNIDRNLVNHQIDDFKYVSSLTDEDYDILNRKWPFVRMFSEKTVNIRKYENIDPNLIIKS